MNNAEWALLINADLRNRSLNDHAEKIIGAIKEAQNEPLEREKSDRSSFFGYEARNSVSVARWDRKARQEALEKSVMAKGRFAFVFIAFATTILLYMAAVLVYPAAADLDREGWLSLDKHSEILIVIIPIALVFAAAVRAGGMHSDRKKVNETCKTMNAQMDIRERKVIELETAVTQFPKGHPLAIEAGYLIPNIECGVHPCSAADELLARMKAHINQSGMPPRAA